MNGVIPAPQTSVALERRVKTKIVASGSTIPQYGAVTSTGKIANSDTDSHRGRVAGLAQNAIPDGTAGYVITEGYIQNASWTFTAGSVVYLNGTSLSHTCPTQGFRVIIGRAISPTEIYVQLSEQILISVVP